MLGHAAPPTPASAPRPAPGSAWPPPAPTWPVGSPTGQVAYTPWGQAQWRAAPPFPPLTGGPPAVPPVRYGPPTLVPVPEPTLAGLTPETLDPSVRRSLVHETWFVMLVFLWPAITGAIIGLVEGLTNVAGISDFGHYIANPFGNMTLGIIAYLPTAAAVPLALYLLSRTGQGPRVIGLGWPRFTQDIWPGLGLAAAAWGVSFGAAVILTPVINDVKHAVVTTSVSGIPNYYVIYGIAISLTTAIAEETFVNGYIITRLAQLGWSKEKAMWLAVALRTSYHVYYGLGFLFTIPLGIFVTRSFQKHRRLNRAIAAHFLYDAVLFTLSILVLQHIHVN